MFKTSLTAAAFTLIAGLSNAATTPLDLNLEPSVSAQILEEAAQIDQVAYFCEWVTVYDFYGNWVTLWQCY